MLRNRQPLLRAALSLSTLCGLLGNVGLCLLPSPAQARAKAVERATSAPVPRAFLPLVAGPPASPQPELAVYDFDGSTVRVWDWLESTFGAVILERGAGAARVKVLRAIEGPSALTIRVENPAGTPRQNLSVVFHWPDAPELQPEEAACGLTRGIVGRTNDKGEVGFGMGAGAYYFPPDSGPHTVWVAVEGTDCLRGMGMLGGTNHKHLDSVWTVP